MGAEMCALGAGGGAGAQAFRSPHRVSPGVEALAASLTLCSLQNAGKAFKFWAPSLWDV